jgi:hypothetical protein
MIYVDSVEAEKGIIEIILQLALSLSAWVPVSTITTSPN